MKKLVFALCALISMVSMSSCTADSIDDANPTIKNKSADNYIDDPTKPH